MKKLVAAVTVAGVLLAGDCRSAQRAETTPSAATAPSPRAPGGPGIAGQWLRDAAGRTPLERPALGPRRHPRRREGDGDTKGPEPESLSRARAVA